MQSDAVTRYVIVNRVGILRVPTHLIRKQKHTTSIAILIKPNCQHASLRLHQQFLLLFLFLRELQPVSTRPSSSSIVFLPLINTTVALWLEIASRPLPSHDKTERPKPVSNWRSQCLKNAIRGLSQIARIGISTKFLAVYVLINYQNLNECLAY